MSNKYADEGSVAHELAAMCLRENKDAAAYIGRVIECEDYPHSELAPSSAHRWMLCLGSPVLEGREAFVPRKFSLEVTDEMAEDVQTYLDNVRAYADGHTMLIEHHVDLSHVLGDGQGGTGDVFIITDDELQAHDLKFGRGVDVSAHKNKQLLMYGTGALPLAEMLTNVKRFRGVIHQPRITAKPKEWDCSIDELRAFAKLAEAAVKGVRYAKTQPIEKIEKFLVTGDHCTFCRGAARCPKILGDVTQAAFGRRVATADDFEDLTATVEVPRGAALLGALYPMLDLIETFASAVRASAESELLAGVAIPGLKLVQGKRGNRKWTSDAEAEAAMKKMKLRQDEMYSFKLISPPAAEKVLKENPRRWGTLQKLITQADGKPHVAPESDSRPVYTPRVASDEDFADVTTSAAESLA